MPGVLRRIRIIPVAVFVPDLAIGTVYDDLALLILSYVTSSIDCIALRGVIGGHP